MPGRDFGLGPYGGPGHMLFGMAFLGLSLLFWLGIPALLVWAALRWIGPRAQGWEAAPVVARRPSAVETLAQRYALGEIDTETFESMVERILGAEARRHQAYQSLQDDQAPEDFEDDQDFEGDLDDEGYDDELTQPGAQPPTLPIDGEVYHI